MALAGVHVTCCKAGSLAPGADRRNAAMPLLHAPIWSQTMATGSVTTGSVPFPASDTDGVTVMAVRASLDVWIAIGGNPNAAANPRLFVEANSDRDIIVKPGDKLAWIAA